MDNYLIHHGIQGQKWGVRRFQNEDGSLTPAGEKRYYTNDGHFSTLNKKGEAYNAKVDKQVRKKSDKALKILSKDKDFLQKKQAYNDALKKNSDFYLKERNKWFKGEKGYKNKDYYEFKDISFERYIKSKDWKSEQKARAEVERRVSDILKNNKNFNTPIVKLESYKFGKGNTTTTTNYTEILMKRIHNDLVNENSKSKGRK